MAVDKFTALADEGPSNPEPPADAWKDKNIQREHTPEKVQSKLTYRQIENQIVRCDEIVAEQQARKSGLEADLIKIEAVANPD